MQINITDLIKNKSSIDILLEKLNAKAHACNGYEYGLPLYDEGQKEILRSEVLAWLVSFEQKK